MVRRCCNLDHVAAHAKNPTELLDAGCPVQLVAQQVSRYEKLARERVCFLLGRGRRVMRRVKEVMSELVGDREPLTVLRLLRGNLDPSVGESAAEWCEVVTLDDLQAAVASDRVHGYRGPADTVLSENAQGHLSGMRRVRLFNVRSPARNSQRGIYPGRVGLVVKNSRRATLGAVADEARGLDEAFCAFGLGTAISGHLHRPLICSFATWQREPSLSIRQTVYASAKVRLSSGLSVTMKGAVMDKREANVFKEVERLRGREGGLGEQLDRYRQSRDQYEKLRSGQPQEKGPSIPLKGSPRQAGAARSTPRGAFGRAS